MTKVFCADLESSGLLHQLIEQGNKAKLHNVCLMDISNMQRRVYHFKDKDELQTIFDEGCILIMHNGICYDKHALIHFGFDVSNVTFLDTLPLSWYLDLNRPKHGLEDYGVEFGVPKPKIDDWENLTQEDYDHRVKEDVRIQYLTYQKLKGRFEELYGDLDDVYFSKHYCTRYLMFKMEQLAEQQNTKFKVDIPKAQQLIEDFDILLEDRKAQLISVMPKVPIKSKIKRPAKPFKKDGSLSAHGEKWKYYCEGTGLPFTLNDFPFIEYDEIELVKGYDEPNPQSTAQLKDWLFGLGWIPRTIKYERQDDGSDREIPQIYVPKSGGQICPSIEELSEKVPEVKALVGLGVVKHRKGVVQGFLDSIVLGDMCEAGANGFTNTLRLKHRKPFVNLPSSRVDYGVDVRSCVIAKEGKKFVCSDLSSMENIWKFNYQMEFDPEYVKSQMSDDFDPHLDLANEGRLLTDAEVYFYKIEKSGFDVSRYPKSDELDELLTLDGEEKKSKLQEISELRGKGKSCVYSLQYNCGVKTLARTAGVSHKQAKVILNAYRKMNWSIDEVVKKQTRKKTSHGTYQYNPYTKLWYYLKVEKDSFSTLVQGSGSYLLDIWLKFIDNELSNHPMKDEINLNYVAQAHDECLKEFNDIDGYEDVVKDIFQKALDRVNEYLKVDIPFGCDTQFGYDYSQIH